MSELKNVTSYLHSLSLELAFTAINFKQVLLLLKSNTRKEFFTLLSLFCSLHPQNRFSSSRCSLHFRVETSVLPSLSLFRNGLVKIYSTAFHLSTPHFKHRTQTFLSHGSRLGLSVQDGVLQTSFNNATFPVQAKSWLKLSERLRYIHIIGI